MNIADAQLAGARLAKRIRSWLDVSEDVSSTRLGLKTKTKCAVVKVRVSILRSKRATVLVVKTLILS